MLAAIADTHALLQVIVASLIAGVGVCIAFSLVVFGLSRSADLRRGGQSTAASAYMVLGFVALAVFAAGVAYGISVMASK